MRLSSIKHGLEMVRCFGIRWAAWRAVYDCRKKTRAFKARFPTPDLRDVSLDDLVRPGTPTEPGAYAAFREASSARFLFAAGKLPSRDRLREMNGEAGCRRVIEVADDFAAGRFLYYSRHRKDLGQPVNWLLNPFTGGAYTADRHWCDTPTFSPSIGDIKDVWEPSRFACAFWLVRAYALTGDEKYPEAFWSLFESWVQQNPPNRGPNWKCGQETALRTMAWCFALYGFWRAEATTPDRVTRMAKLIALQAARIAGNIAYAVLQKNNHGISEAVGLLTVGLLYPEFREAAAWLATGRRILEAEVKRQVYDDGSYVQQSMSYHRVMLHDCLWAMRLAELNEQSLSRALIDRVNRASVFLHGMLDESSGRVPNYGPNDGALILPLSSCDYGDYRPTVQAGRFLATGKRVLAPGAWDESLIWLFGEETVSQSEHGPLPQHSKAFDTGGYYTLRGGDSWGMVRCHTYRDRIGHVDPLHFDLWYRGENILGDSGTYKYFVPDAPAMERYFKDVRSHNTIELDGRGPLKLVSRFMWLPWPQALCREHGEDRWMGEHLAYARSPYNAVHRRAVERLDETTWRISDTVIGDGEHDVTLRWQLGDREYTFDEKRHRVDLSLPHGQVSIEIECPDGFCSTIHRGVADGEHVAGWQSVYYGECTPRPTLVIAGRCTLPVSLVTHVRFNERGDA